jgi:hypothetical protein
VTARRGFTLLVQAMAWTLVLTAKAYAQSGDEPPLDVRLRGYLLSVPMDQTKAPAPPTEGERSREEARRSQDAARRAREEAGRSPGAPGYVGPLSTDTSTGRMGAAGWVAPAVNPPGHVSSPERAAGHFGFGYAVEWGVPRRGGAEAP